ncbi:PREDICTED: uncharacterized protein LOC104824066 [Tarenaya hassleriana]|uniref:uncharacterized protein LOC104824066 n=1 Tax=Tarenaya hassleriana TaxID=28532 RepID=UPI00053C8E5F|nr:PREDICTED: uncharacterized protein LOC104824066 [Tarenaya hassleriana]
MILSRFTHLSHPNFILHESRLTQSPRISKIQCSNTSSSSSSSCGVTFRHLLHQSAFPLAASLTLLLSPSPASAGLMSGFPGIESVPGPELPQIDFLNRFNEANQKMYAENDARFKESPLLKKLLEKSKQNKEKNEREVQDKYCLRGAEWGVGDCSTAGMTEEEKEKFIAMLKEKAAAPK